MSWDVFISKTPIDQLSGAKFESLGSKKEVIKGLKEIIPTAYFKDPQWGIFREDSYSIEINLGEEELVEYLMLHVRGEGSIPLLVIKEICETYQCFAMDGSSGEELDFDKIEDNPFLEWQKYRDKILRKM